MKMLAVFIALLVSAPSQAAYFACNVTEMRQHGPMPGNGRLYFNYWKNGSSYFLKNVAGTIRAGGTNADDSYIGYFNSAKQFKNDANYRPTKYKNAVKFDSVDADRTAGLESGMWGDLVIDQAPKAGVLKARYIFQAGDHMGGTALLDCRE